MTFMRKPFSAGFKALWVSRLIVRFSLGIVTTRRRPPLPAAGGRMGAILDFIFILDGILREQIG